jgi:adenine-specific DNA methylase
LLVLSTLSDLVCEVRAIIENDARIEISNGDDQSLAEGGSGPKAYAEAVSVYLGFLVGQLANHSSTICGWNSPNQQMRSTFSRQALPMTWDFAEVNPFSESSGSFHNLFTRQVKGFEALGSGLSNFDTVRQIDAQNADYNALANSVVLVCRKKEASADVVTRAEFIRALKRELPPAIAELQAQTSPRPICRNPPLAQAWACSRATRPCWNPTTVR